MIGASDTFRAGVRAGYQQVATDFEVWQGGAATSITLNPVDAEVSVDRTRAFRRTVTGTFVDYSGLLVPAETTSLLAPYGNEVSLSRGLVIGGVTYLVPLGVFVLTSANASDGNESVQVAIDGIDRAFWISTNKFLDYSDSGATWAAGATLYDFVATVAVSRYPSVILDLPSDLSGFTLPAIQFDVAGEADPWQVLVSTCQERGWDLYFDETGALTARVITNPDGDPVVATYEDDSESVLIDVENDISTEEAINVVVATGESADSSPYRSVAYDDNPNSPTYYLGSFGTRPKFVSSPTIATQADCDAFAAATLALEKGAKQDVNWTMLVDPTLEPGDVISLSRAAVGLTDRTFAVDSLTIPLAANRGMAVRARTRTGV